MTVKHFSIGYYAINSKNTFTNGDTINGWIILEVSKQTTIQSLIFTAQGRAQVFWDENYNDLDHQFYSAKETFYEFKQHILRESRQDGTEVIGKGRHIFPFSFNIPDRKIPSSFKDSIGKIVHMLTAELKRSQKRTKKAEAHFIFVSKADMDILGLMERQSDCIAKTIQVFGSGTVGMEVRTKRMGYQQGEPFQVTVEICNLSTRTVKPKLVLYEMRSFFAQGHRNVHTKKIHKVKLEAVASSSNKTVVKMITFALELPPSILNCSIIKLEYMFKIHLDIKCATYREINLPIVVLPENPAINQPHVSAGIGFQAFGNPNHLTWSATPQQLPLQPADPSPSFGAHAVYPNLADTDIYKTAL